MMVRGVKETHATMGSRCEKSGRQVSFLSFLMGILSMAANGGNESNSSKTWFAEDGIYDWSLPDRVHLE
jgi:hypothetical protein